MARQSFRQTLRRILVFDLTDNKRVVAHDFIFAQSYIGLRGAGLLILQRVTNEETIECFSIAIEGFSTVIEDSSSAIENSSCALDTSLIATPKRVCAGRGPP